jgi:hypothetical protein
VIDIFPAAFPIFVNGSILVWGRMELQGLGRLAVCRDLVSSILISLPSCSLAVRLESMGGCFKMKALLRGCPLFRVRDACSASRLLLSSSGLSSLSNVIGSSAMPLARILCAAPKELSTPTIAARERRSTETRAVVIQGLIVTLLSSAVHAWFLVCQYGLVFRGQQTCQRGEFIVVVIIGTIILCYRGCYIGSDKDNSRAGDGLNTYLELRPDNLRKLEHLELWPRHLHQPSNTSSCCLPLLLTPAVLQLGGCLSRSAGSYRGS